MKTCSSMSYLSNVIAYRLTRVFLSIHDDEQPLKYEPTFPRRELDIRKATFKATQETCGRLFALREIIQDMYGDYCLEQVWKVLESFRKDKWTNRSEIFEMWEGRIRKVLYQNEDHIGRRCKNKNTEAL